MKKLKAILLTEGMHGMISQTEGLAKSLELDFIHEKIELNRFWRLVPPVLTPINKQTFKNKILDKFDVVISCGRKSVIPSIFLKRKYKNKILTIHIQDPKVSLKNFDYVIAPIHDKLTGNNVLNTKGSIHYLTINEIDQNKNYLESKIDKRKKIVSFIIGGPNKYYDYQEKTILEVFLKIKTVFLENNYQAIIIPSMRTPKYIIEKAKSYFNEDQILIPTIDKKAYLSSLKLANHIVVTCDSTSMISEAAITGKPIYVAQMPPIKENLRFKEFFALFQSLKITRDLDSSFENWSYQKLDETNRVSNYIKQKIKVHDFS